MSILIKGMEMPTSCLACMFSRTDIRNVDWCVLTEKDLPCDCPIVPVPEHGPLVDVLDVINAFPDEFIFTNEQARALTNYIIPADPAEEGER